MTKQTIDVCQYVLNKICNLFRIIYMVLQVTEIQYDKNKTLEYAKSRNKKKISTQ